MKFAKEIKAKLVEILKREVTTFSVFNIYMVGARQYTRATRAKCAYSNH